MRFCIFAYILVKKALWARHVCSSIRPHVHPEPLQRSEPQLGDGSLRQGDSVDLTLFQNTVSPPG